MSPCYSPAAAIQRTEDTMNMKERLLREYDEIEDAIEDAALSPYWDLAQWLAVNVPNEGRGRPENVARPTITLADVAARRGRARSWLQDMRKVAQTTEPDRLPNVSVRVYLQALRNNNWDLVKANKALSKGKRLRDQTGPMESVKALAEQLSKRTPEERAQVAAQIVDENTAAAMQATPEGIKATFRVSEAETERMHREHTDQAHARAKTQGEKQNLHKRLQADTEMREEHARDERRRWVRSALMKLSVAAMRLQEYLEEGVLASLFDEAERGKFAVEARQTARKLDAWADAVEEIEGVPDTVPADWAGTK